MPPNTCGQDSESYISRTGFCGMNYRISALVRIGWIRNSTTIGAFAESSKCTFGARRPASLLRQNHDGGASCNEKGNLVVRRSASYPPTRPRNHTTKLAPLKSKHLPKMTTHILARVKLSLICWKHSVLHRTLKQCFCSRNQLFVTYEVRRGASYNE